MKTKLNNDSFSLNENKVENEIISNLTYMETVKIKYY